MTPRPVSSPALQPPRALTAKLAWSGLAACGLTASSAPWLGAWALGWLVPWAYYAGLSVGRRSQSAHVADELWAFKSRLAHEINNPLAIVLEQLSSAVSELERSSQIAGRERVHELRQLADVALGAAERIRQVVHELDGTRRATQREVRGSKRSGPVPAPIRARILIIDDEPQVANSLRRILRRHDVTIATNGFDAAALLDARPFDVVISDVMMPEPSGLDVFERIAASDPALARRFIFVSGGSYTAQAREQLSSIPNLRLPKPVDPVELERAIGAVCDEAGLEAVG